MTQSRDDRLLFAPKLVTFFVLGHPIRIQTVLSDDIATLPEELDDMMRMDKKKVVSNMDTPPQWIANPPLEDLNTRGREHLDDAEWRSVCVW
jgi:hypothetical protein